MKNNAKDDLFVKVDRTIVLNSSILDVYDKAVYFVLMAYADWETGEAYPSIKRICTDAGIGKTRVYKSLDKLSDYGLIEITNRRKDNGQNYTNLYRILPVPDIFRKG